MPFVSILDCFSASSCNHYQAGKPNSDADSIMYNLMLSHILEHSQDFSKLEVARCDLKIWYAHGLKHADVLNSATTSSKLDFAGRRFSAIKHIEHKPGDPE